MENKSYKSGGRPSLPDYKKKKVSINVRLSPMEYAYVTAMAKESGLRPAELARKAILDIKVCQPLTADQWKAINAMNNFGNNLNQLARQGNIGEDVRPQAYELITKISSILKQLNDCQDKNKNRFLRHSQLCQRQGEESSKSDRFQRSFAYQ